VLMERSLSFSAKTAADVMTPRTRLRTVSALAPATTVIEATRETGHSRFPVIGDSIDDIHGVVHVKQAVAVPEPDRSTTRVRQVMAAPVLVPPSMALERLLHLLQERGLQLAVVVDEYGGTAGIVTFEDLVEELVGEVVDEHDSPAAGIRRQPDGTWLLSGLLRPDEIQAAIGLELPAHVSITRRWQASSCSYSAESRDPATASRCPAPSSPWNEWTAGGSTGYG
jgi:CBS domain containing-hemolysin-like protein